MIVSLKRATRERVGRDTEDRLEKLSRMKWKKKRERKVSEKLRGLQSKGQLSCR